MVVIKSKSPSETQNAGLVYSKEVININDIIGLKGPLGSGKTVFAKGITSYFGVKDIVNSPSFLIVNEYKGTDPVKKNEINIFHFDLFRFKNTSELEIIGFEDYINKKDSIFIIEWSELAEKYLSFRFKNVNFYYNKKKNERIIKYSGE